MSINAYQGSQCCGTVQLSNAAPGPVAIPIFAGGRKTATPYTLQATELICVLSLIISSSDATNEIVTITDGAATPTTLLKCYVSSSAPSVVTLTAGILYGYPATNLYATAGAVTSGKSIEVALVGLVVNRS